MNGHYRSTRRGLPSINSRKFFTSARFTAATAWAAMPRRPATTRPAAEFWKMIWACRPPRKPKSCIEKCTGRLQDHLLHHNFPSLLGPTSLTPAAGPGPLCKNRCLSTVKGCPLFLSVEHKGHPIIVYKFIGICFHFNGNFPPRYTATLTAGWVGEKYRESPDKTDIPSDLIQQD
jgi:hypothetical protein